MDCVAKVDHSLYVHVHVYMLTYIRLLFFCFMYRRSCDVDVISSYQLLLLQIQENIIWTCLLFERNGKVEKLSHKSTENLDFLSALKCIQERERGSFWSFIMQPNGIRALKFLYDLGLYMQLHASCVMYTKKTKFVFSVVEIRLLKYRLLT